MADSCQEEKRFPPNCFSAVIFNIYFQGTQRGGTCVATANQTDIRGLRVKNDTAFSCVRPELPLSSLADWSLRLITHTSNEDSPIEALLSTCHSGVSISSEAPHLI